MTRAIGAIRVLDMIIGVPRRATEDVRVNAGFGLLRLSVLTGLPAFLRLVGAVSGLPLGLDTVPIPRDSGRLQCRPTEPVPRLWFFFAVGLAARLIPGSRSQPSLRALDNP